MPNAAPGPPPDEELARASRAGDRDAFSELVRRYQHRVFGLCLHLLGSRHEAEEAAREVFETLFQRLRGSRGGSRLSTRLYRITLDRCRNRARRANRAATGEVPDPGAGGQLPGASAALREALASLDRPLREIVLLRDVEDLDHEELAEVLSLSRSAVRFRLHQARAELGRQLAGNLRLDELL